MFLIGPEYAHLEGVDLAETRMVTFAGTDGGTITGHLTLPAGRDGPVPAVVMPRGIPSRLDVADPHYLVQFLAASGYAVLRVNYRGAEKYGGWLVERAALGWQQASDDVGAAAAYLVSEGIAAPDRICAVGRDLGAYAALMNGVVDPGRLACIVGIGTVADARALAGSTLGNIVTDRDDVIREGSPTRRADEIAAPVFLFHGHFDGAVSMFGHALELNRALERADNDVQYIEYPYGRHDLDRGPYRIDMLTRMGAFLEEQIGAP
jgi:dipeptidyl aminopeptidase/acylaminoacyl peptidase